MSGTPSSPPRIRLSGRSFLALTLTPEAPLADWLHALDLQLARSAGFFSGKPIILDLSLVDAQTPDLAYLQQALEERGVRLIGIEGADRSWPALAGWNWPESFIGGRSSGNIDIPEDDVPAPPAPSTLLLEEPIRSGQHIVWPNGDVIILGSVASGAEVSAGGSIHVYGALRGRAIAGIGGHAEARIFTRHLEAELVAIDGFYATAEEMDAERSGKPTQVVLSGETLTFHPMA
ncbi:MULTISPECIES: septum site-determining protein MinC [Acetobacter]|uniref:Probable septum site-determining protein MinC n=1 Tax=Acetobacter tropicalis TaxID=104102 RepID=A0A0C9LSI0_9PROT|nr:MULTISPECIES: septum site-determining protein MinC [Acetobacter]KXV47945.1 selenocysteine lyase [Acetobacter tropicalis]KXV58129.1 selenocysteine lyase [Acetobacter tropicalis]MCG4257261.1 septum site-determining protein MinC [Acetobacter senegalensis]MCG4259029.1 septum site-determining protein MinC [Acetobacter senegalensis]MCG4267029.1 septum site-determining protein MinC [Acetobacter senegalensis]